MKYSWERLAGLQGSASYLVGGIEAIDTPDDGTVKVTLSASNSAFLAQVGAGYLGIMNKKVAGPTAPPPTPPPTRPEVGSWPTRQGRWAVHAQVVRSGRRAAVGAQRRLLGRGAGVPEVIIKETPQGADYPLRCAAGSCSRRPTGRR